MGHTAECLVDTLDVSRAYRALHFAIEDLESSNQETFNVRLNPGVFNGINLMVGTGWMGGSVPSWLVIRSLKAWKRHVEKILVKRRVDLKSLIIVKPGRSRNEYF